MKDLLKIERKLCEYTGEQIIEIRMENFDNPMSLTAKANGFKRLVSGKDYYKLEKAVELYNKIVELQDYLESSMGDGIDVSAAIKMPEFTTSCREYATKE